MEAWALDNKTTAYCEGCKRETGTTVCAMCLPCTQKVLEARRKFFPRSEGAEWGFRLYGRVVGDLMTARSVVRKRAPMEPTYMLTDAALLLAYNSERDGNENEQPHRLDDALRCVARAVASHIITAHIPSGQYCDPQAIADGIRADYGIE